METCTFICAPCARKSELKSDSEGCFLTYTLNMSDPNGPSTSGTQQVVSVTELLATITEVVKEVLVQLRAGEKSKDEVTLSNAKGR